jgi:hypothetical protein
MKLARLAAAAAIPVLSILGFAGSASAAGTIVVSPNPVPAAGAPNASITGAGWTPGDQLFISQCVDVARQAGGAVFNPATDCEANTAAPGVDNANASGAINENFDIVSGVVSPTTSGGQGFICDSANPCRIRISAGTFLDTANQAFAPITFVAGTAVTTTTVAATTTTTIGDPTPVVPESPLPIMLPIGAAAVLGAGYMMLRKGRQSSVQA